MRSTDLLLTLTDRELEVLTWVAMGSTNSEIAKELHIATETVKSHVRRILDKLEAKNRSNAVFIAMSHGWLMTGLSETKSSPSQRSLYE